MPPLNNDQMSTKAPILGFRAVHKFDCFIFPANISSVSSRIPTQTENLFWNASRRGKKGGSRSISCENDTKSATGNTQPRFFFKYHNQIELLTASDALVKTAFDTLLKTEHNKLLNL